MLDIAPAVADGTATVRLAGEIDLDTAPDLVTVVVNLMLDHDLRHVGIDIAQVNFMDSSALAAFVKMSRIVSSHGATLSVRGAAPHIRKMFRLTGIDQVVPLIDDDSGRRDPGEGPQV